MIVEIAFPIPQKQILQEVTRVPTYGYQCTECKHQFQVFQSMKDDPVSICPECTGAVKRLLYPVGVVFKGSGWYINDSRKPEASPEGATKPAETSTTETKSTETKSETKTETTSTPATPVSPTPATKS